MTIRGKVTKVIDSPMNFIVVIFRTLIGSFVVGLLFSMFNTAFTPVERFLGFIKTPLQATGWDMFSETKWATLVTNMTNLFQNSLSLGFMGVANMPSGKGGGM